MSLIPYSRVEPDPEIFADQVRLDGARKKALQTGRNRIMVAAVAFLMAFATVAGRLVDLSVGGVEIDAPSLADAGAGSVAVERRGDVIDRNGVVLATSLPTVSLFADPTEILDADEAADKLVGLFPEMDRAKLVERLSAQGRFIWLRRNLTPRQQYDVIRLGIPGLDFKEGEHRVYPHGIAAAHILGFTDIDGHGIAGIERRFDSHLDAARPVRLSIDVRIQDLMRTELAAAVEEFRALGGAGVVMDVDTGEILATVSLPDFDANLPETALGEAGFNRVTKGVYEMGSTFKLFNTAMALDTGTVSMRDGYDASQPLRVARFTITDYHAKNRWLSVPEILIHSSNIGSAKMALDVGAKAQQDYLRRLGLLDAPSLEIPEVSPPLVPATWREINTMTISYGHGIAITPIQLAAAVSTLVNGGFQRSATLLAKTNEGIAEDAMEGEGDPIAPAVKRVLSEQTSRNMRELMRMVVEQGTGGKADAAGYRVGGKTGTAEKQVNGGYRATALLSSFVAAFPMDAPRYVILAVLDEPHGTKNTQGYATGGWVAAPVVGRVVERMAPLVGIAPSRDDWENNVAQALKVSYPQRERGRASF